MVWRGEGMYMDSYNGSNALSQGLNFEEKYCMISFGMADKLWNDDKHSLTFQSLSTWLISFGMLSTA